jgi:hypothetical protein
MKRCLILLGLTGALSTGAVRAALQITMMDNTSEYSYGNGGEFRAVPSSDLLTALNNLSGYAAVTKGTVTSATDGSSWGYQSAMAGAAYFQTFCIEYNEEFSPGTTYSVSLSNNALYGGNKPDGDPISIGTAWLYKTFAAGTLSGYNYAYSAGRQSQSSAGALQQAIWWLEEEPNGVRNSFIDAAEEALYGAGNTGGGYDTKIRADANGLYGVQVMNLGVPGEVQDQLVIVPVPEPTTLIAGALLLLPFGLSGLRMLRGIRI